MILPPVIPDFEILRRIGGGSYGEVWIGRSVTGIYRAIKIVDRQRFEDSRPFLREFDGIKRFQKAVGGQPLQLALLHVGRDDEAGIFYYVMELADDAVAGTDIDPATYIPLTLKELRIRRTTPLPTEDCIRIGAELTRALNDLHEAGLVHRDVKPSNIIFVSGVPKLADVGLITSSEHTLTSLGTPGYAPPEGGGTAKADLYSLGKILYELATGLGPDEFPRLPVGVMATERLTRFSEINEVILRACDPDPARRYISAKAMLDDLLLLQAGRSVRELNRTKLYFRYLLRIGAVLGVAGAIALSALATRNFIALKRIAAQEIAFRKQAESDDRLARYTADLHLARLALSSGDFGATRTALRRQIPLASTPDARGFEWYALWNETKGEASKEFGHIGSPAVSAVVLSPDGREIAVQEGNRPRDTAIWNISTGQRRLLSHDTLGLGGFSPDAFRIVVGTVDRKIHEVNLATGQMLLDQSVSGRLLQAIEDGRSILLSEQNPASSRLIIWDFEAQQEFASWQAKPRDYSLSLSAASVSRDRRYLAASMFWAEGVERKYEVTVYNVLEKTERYHVGDVEGPVQSLRFSPDNHWLAIARYGLPISIHSVVTGKEVLRLAGHSGGISALDFSPDSRFLASGGTDQSLHVWDLQTGQPRAVLRGHESDILALSWTADGASLVTGGEDGTCRLWGFPPQNENRIEGLWTKTLGDFIFAPDGKSVVATDSTGQIGIFDTLSRRRIGTISGAFQPLTFDEDGRTLLALSRNNYLVRCDLALGTVESSKLTLALSQGLAAVEASAKHHLAAFGFEGGKVELWDLANAKSLGLRQPQSRLIVGLGWSPNGQHLAVGDQDGRWKILSVNLSIPEQILPQQAQAIRSIAYSFDGKWMAIGKNDGRVMIRDMFLGQILPPLEGHSSTVTSLAFSPDGSRLVTGGRDGLIIFWSLSPFRQIAVWALDAGLHGATQHAIYRLKFDDSGKQLAALTEDGRLQIWSAH